MRLVVGLALGSAIAVAWAKEPRVDRGPIQDVDPLAAVVSELSESGVRLDLERGRCAIDARVLARYQPLEYLLVGERGQAHESLFGTEVEASLLNTALLLLGAEPGQNARWVEVESDEAEGTVENDGLGGPPAEPEDERPAPKRFAIEPPEGDGFYLYAAWVEDDETYLYRVEDLIANVEEARSMRRHRFVFLGSKMIQPRQDSAEEVFAADLEQNLINVAYFRAGHTLLTTATSAASSEDAWFANHWLVPGEGKTVRLVFSRSRIAGLPAGLGESVAAPDPIFGGLPSVAGETDR